MQKVTLFFVDELSFYENLRKIVGKCDIIKEEFAFTKGILRKVDKKYHFYSGTNKPIFGKVVTICLNDEQLHLLDIYYNGYKRVNIKVKRIYDIRDIYKCEFLTEYNWQECQTYTSIFKYIKSNRHADVGNLSKYIMMKIKEEY